MWFNMNWLTNIMLLESPSIPSISSWLRSFRLQKWSDYFEEKTIINSDICTNAMNTNRSRSHQIVYTYIGTNWIRDRDRSFSFVNVNSNHWSWLRLVHYEHWQNEFYQIRLLHIRASKQLFNVRHELNWHYRIAIAPHNGMIRTRIFQCCLTPILCRDRDRDRDRARPLIFVVVAVNILNEFPTVLYYTRAFIKFIFVSNFNMWISNIEHRTSKLCTLVPSRNVNIDRN
jgi:hypothetical protein